jgi:hypothetical protein
MRVKYLKVADGKKHHIENFPCCHVTGSIKGMKKYCEYPLFEV